MNFQMREFGLEIIFHVVHHARRAACGGGHMETIFRDAAHNTVIHHEARFIEHHAIAKTTNFEFRPWIGVEKIHEFGSIGANNFDLAKC